MQLGTVTESQTALQSRPMTDNLCLLYIGGSTFETAQQISGTISSLVYACGQNC